MHSKGNYKQGEKTILGMGENNSKWNNWQRINLQNIKAAHAAEHQKKQPNQKVGRRPKQTFHQRNTQMDNKHMKRCSTSLIIREIQTKQQWGITSHPLEWPSPKNLQTINAGEGLEKRETLLHCWWEWYSHYREEYGDSLKNYE